MTYNSFLGYDPDDDGLLPDGEYVATITDCKIATTKTNTGKYMLLNFRVESGEHTGYEITKLFNIHNQKKDTQQLARNELNAVMNSLGIKDPRSESDFCNIRTIITVSSEFRKDLNPPRKQNVILNYRRYEYDAAPTPTERPY